MGRRRESATSHAKRCTESTRATKTWGPRNQRIRKQWELWAQSVGRCRGLPRGPTRSRNTAMPSWPGTPWTWMQRPSTTNRRPRRSASKPSSALHTLALPSSPTRFRCGVCVCVWERVEWAEVSRVGLWAGAARTKIVAAWVPLFADAHSREHTCTHTRICMQARAHAQTLARCQRADTHRRRCWPRRAV